MGSSIDSWNRRQFVKASALSASGLFLPQHVFGEESFEFENIPDGELQRVINNACWAAIPEGDELETALKFGAPSKFVNESLSTLPKDVMDALPSYDAATLLNEDYSLGQEAVFARSLIWKDRLTLRVYIPTGNSELQDKVESATKEWSRWSKLQLLPTKQSGGAEIRVSFKDNVGHKSLVGSASLKSNLPGLNSSLNIMPRRHEDLYRVALHELGHAIGMLHEHQSPDGNAIKWDIPRATAIYKQLTQNQWNANKIYQNVLKKFEWDQVNASEFDPRSVMLYPIPKGASTSHPDGLPGWKNELSYFDKIWAAKMYGPGAEIPEQKSSDTASGDEPKAKANIFANAKRINLGSFETGYLNRNERVAFKFSLTGRREYSANSVKGEDWYPHDVELAIYSSENTSKPVINFRSGLTPPKLSTGGVLSGQEFASGIDFLRSPLLGSKIELTSGSSNGPVSLERDQDYFLVVRARHSFDRVRYRVGIVPD